jgi:tetratricopeptide (TPR) repeat protein
MSQPILLEYYRELPQRRPDEKDRAWSRRFREGMDCYRRCVEARYGEGTLERLLESGDAEVRQAAVTALGMLGSMRVNASLARLLHDEDGTVRSLAEEALWSLWSLAGGAKEHAELQALMTMQPKNQGPEQLLAGFDALIEKVPGYAEAFNQRAILFFRLGQWDQAIADCTRVLKLNPYHFGAAAGLAQCYLKQKKLRAALRAYRRAFRINPNLEGVEQVIQSLERKLGEEGRK